MGVSLGLIGLGIVLLAAGGEVMLRGAVGLSTLLRLTPAFIGLTVVAMGTSVPELAVSATAAGQGKVDIAVANVVGSNIFNLAFILGVCALLSPIVIGGNTVKLEYPVLVAVTVICMFFMYDGVIDRTEAGIFLLIYVAFTFYLVRLVRKQVTDVEQVELKVEVAELSPATRPNIWSCLMLVIGGIVLLGLGAQSTVSGAVELARYFGLSERVIGLTIVSAGTSLPEVVASLVSSVRGRNDVAVGNVIGSNLFNMLCILGICGAVAPLSVAPPIINNDAWWMLGITVILYPMLFTGRRISRKEGSLLLIIFAAYITYLLKFQT